MIICKKLMTKKPLIGSVLGAMLSAAIITGCAVVNGIEADRDSDYATVSREISERGGSEAGGEHGIRESGDESGGSSAEDSGDESSAKRGSESGGEGNELGGGESGNEGSESGGESAGEHGGRGGEVGSGGGNENSGGEINEAAMSSPVIPLNQSWNGTLGGLAVAMQYDAATKSVHGTVQNATSRQLCYVQAEPHLKSGAMTIGELGPDRLGDLNPGQEVTSSLSVADEPTLTGVSYDGYVVHMEVFDCAGSGPTAHSNGEGTEAGGEHGPDSEEGSRADALAPDETIDIVRSGARLILSYDAPSNSFKGVVENTTSGVLERVRVEVHLSNGAELGPTTPTDMAPGEVLTINLPATTAPFTGWTTHAEIGSGDEGSESSGEHGSGRESGDEHGGAGERRGGG